MADFDAKQYWESRLSGRYDLTAVGDISLSDNYNKWSYKVTRRVLKRLFQKYSTQADKQALDIGSGTGFIVSIWKELNRSVTGIDISATAVKNLKQSFPEERFIEFDLGAGPIDLPDNSFDQCSAASVLYHIVDDEALKRALANIHRLLKPNGYFIFSENFIHESERDIVHQKIRTLADYEQLVQEAGFKIINRVPNYVLFNDPVDARGKFYPRLWSWNIRLSRRFPFYDRLIWPLLFPVELLLTRLLRESPAQELMICQAVK